MKKLMRIMGILLAAVLMMAVISCGDNENQDKTENSDYTGDTPKESEESQEITDVFSALASLPSENYGGYEFQILTSNWFNPTLEGRQAPEETQNGETVNDALYIRDTLVEDKYNITIKYEIIDSVADLVSKAFNLIMSGDPKFDFIMDNMRTAAKDLSLKGVIYDFNTVPNTDLTREWWSKYAKQDLTINGKFYFPTGDITARYPLSFYAMLFNKKLFADNGIEYPYKKVLSGSWTFDEFAGMIKDQNRDLDGDGKISKKNDFYGYVCEPMSAFSFLHAGGESLIKITGGNPVLNTKNERTINIVDKLLSFWNDPTSMWATANYVTYDEVAVFKEDRAMFLSTTGTDISLFRDMESDFGIVPLPKYDAKQTEYFSYFQSSAVSAVCVPVTVTDLERTGMIIEALAAVGRYTSTPAVYEITLKRKYARDAESEGMLDLICAGSRYDFSRIYDWGGVYSQYINVMTKGGNFVSTFEAIEEKAKAEIENTISMFE